jgi:DNA-binding GntR family transcriptional regulator
MNRAAKLLKLDAATSQPGDWTGERATTRRMLDRIVAGLEEDIVLGHLHPRERLIEDELIDRFGAKRHVVRQALTVLEHMGLIERPPGRGACVRVHTERAVEQIYAMRELLEAEAARLIPLPLPEAALTRLQASQAVHDAAAQAADPAAIFRANLEFHRTLFGLCDNELLVEAVENHAQKTHGIRFHSLIDPALVARAQAEHQAMIQAIAASDRVALVQLCRAHLGPSKAAYLQAFRRPGHGHPTAAT